MGAVSLESATALPQGKPCAGPLVALLLTKAVAYWVFREPAMPAFAPTNRHRQFVGGDQFAGGELHVGGELFVGGDAIRRSVG